MKIQNFEYKNFHLLYFAAASFVNFFTKIDSSTLIPQLAIKFTPFLPSYGLFLFGLILISLILFINL